MKMKVYIPRHYVIEVNVFNLHVHRFTSYTELLSPSQDENSPSQDPPVDEERLISPNDDSLTDCTSHSSSTCTTPTYPDFTSIDPFTTPS